ncbi:MAG: hypothetical protein ACSLEM_04710 [Candidatus Malihini olakiniferum]
MSSVIKIEPEKEKETTAIDSVMKEGNIVHWLTTWRCGSGHGSSSLA